MSGGEALHARLAAWEAAWELPGFLTGTVAVRYSDRLRRTLGRALPARGELVLHTALRSAPPALHDEVLCHEAAHLAAAERARRAGAARPRAHGPEWAALVRAAGYEPRVTAPREWATLLPGSQREAPRPPRPRADVVHRCPVCQMTRRARRVVRGWRCATCVAHGLSGELVIERPSAR